jgi:nicotinamide mononucleotide transporter
MIPWWSVDTIALNVWGYPLSYVELVGTALYLWSVWLIARRNILTWPVGIVSVLCYMLLFYQIQLYADTGEQVYYLVISLYGWWHWYKEGPAEDGTRQVVTYSNLRQAGMWLILTLTTSALFGWLLSQIHLWWPTLFSLPASFPYLDALTTVMSFTAMWLMAQKRTESWIYWIVVDVLGVWLYFVKDVRFLALLYVVLLGMAMKGWWEWHHSVQRTAVPRETAIL